MEVIKKHSELVELMELNEYIIGHYKACLNKINELLEKEMSNNSPKMKTGTSYLDADAIHGGKAEMRFDLLEKIVEEKNTLEDKIRTALELKKIYQVMKEKMNIALEKLKGIENDVYRMNVGEGLSLKEIADKLGYSYDYIREVKSKINKKLEIIKPHNEHTDTC